MCTLLDIQLWVSVYCRCRWISDVLPMHQLHASPESGLIKCLGWGESQAKEWENAVLWFLLRLLHLTTTTTATRQSFQHLASRRQWGDRRLAAPAQHSPAQPSPGQLQVEWEPSRGWQVESAAAWRQQSAWLPNEILTAAGNSQLPAASHRGFLFSLLPPVQSWGQIVMAHGGMADWYCYCWLHSGGLHWNVCFQFWTHQVDIA